MLEDKQIIIDGVPVQDCCYFDYENDGYEDSCYIHQNECSAQNCYYKQLKRKEQEYEELKEEKQGLIKDWEEKKNLAYEIACKNEKLKQTLIEIKEIAEHCIKQDICTTCDNSDKCHIEDEEIPTYDICKLILQKISEVENEFHS